MMATDNPVLDAHTTMQLEYALSRNEFELYYQPLIDVCDHSIQGVEALIRWHHPQRGLLNPTDFIPLAEQTGLIVAIGAWVLRQACSDFRRLQQISSSDLLLSVNVSTCQLDQPDFIANLAKVLRETGIAPHSLQLEITESVFLRDSPRIGTLFQTLRALGVKIAFDDFGTGYCSLNYLAAYPADLVKIDQCFVQRMSSSYVHTEIVQSIIHLAHTIGMSVCAEGVEDSDQAAELARLGCNIAQGYLYSPALPFAAMAALLERPAIAPRAPGPGSVRPTLAPLSLALAK
jgi:EAL domain-containing protein (putative c-di-GMP-specific phosphodiesterase class I)